MNTPKTRTSRSVESIRSDIAGCQRELDRIAREMGWEHAANSLHMAKVETELREIEANLRLLRAELRRAEQS